MANLLSDFEGLPVSVITNDGRNIVGTLAGMDQLTNLILEDCHERVHSPEGTEQVPLGLYIVRGDNICAVGEVDLALDKGIDFSQLRGEPLA
eukprot:CAMPEP_0174229052 /NCGR_PEP_ID=MMETSP0417-20130205/121_1 /TAXON_ID=242541 /ORGANISM="Mayorella sp, Strain BSH-02190019" /LENGTH=91 /DNA_ID=CAMNT_0015306553 /DNA_START=130 /DNA_END=401 /DNA_ORIENTATION=+